MTADDPRYLSATAEQMSLDFWSDYYFRHPNDETQQFDNADFDADVKAMLDDDSLWEDA